MTFILLLIACCGFAAFQGDYGDEPCSCVQRTIGCDGARGVSDADSAEDLIDSDQSMSRISQVYFGCRRWADRVDLGRKCVGAAFVVMGSVAFGLGTTLVLYSVVKEPIVAPFFMLGCFVFRRNGLL